VRNAPALARSALVLGALAAALPAGAQFWTRPDPRASPTDVAPPVLQEVRIDERLGNAVPLEVDFVDAGGKPFRLARAFDGKKPVVLALVYYDCPMMCGLILSGVAKAMRENGLALGEDYEAVTISFDPEEPPALAAERRRGYLQSLGRSDAAATWPFLVGRAEASRAVADAVGFHYAQDPATGEWAHLAAVFVLTPEGKVSRYLYGVEHRPKDFRLAVVEAADGKVGTSFDRFLLTCYRYDPATRKYEPYALGFVRAGAVLVLALLAGLIARLAWRERKARAREARAREAT
jgi:protein SCO1/2